MYDVGVFIRSIDHDHNSTKAAVIYYCELLFALSVFLCSLRHNNNNNEMFLTFYLYICILATNYIVEEKASYRSSSN